MAEIKSSKTKDGLLLSGAVPPELSSASSLEIFALRDGIFLLAVKGAIGGRQAPSQAAGAGAGSSSQFTEKEKELIRKMLAIRFERRIPAEVAKLLSKDEKETLGSLIAKKAVQIFHGGKYEKEGVYNVSDAAFNSVREPVQSSLPSPGAIAVPVSTIAHLDSYGWMVLENEADARGFGNAFSEKVKSGDVRGTRAFDMKYYFVRRAFFEEWEKKVLLSLTKSEKSAEEVAAEAGMDAGGCHALLLHLCDSGEAMEKHRGKFTRA